jgi:hypothetical protein
MTYGKFIYDNAGRAFWKCVWHMVSLHMTMPAMPSGKVYDIW